MLLAINRHSLTAVFISVLAFSGGFFWQYRKTR
jgi:hypothetical protein